MLGGGGAGWLNSDIFPPLLSRQDLTPYLFRRGAGHSLSVKKGRRNSLFSVDWRLFVLGEGYGDCLSLETEIGGTPHPWRQGMRDPFILEMGKRGQEIGGFVIPAESDRGHLIY